METVPLDSTAKLSNSINTIGFSAFNSRGTITRHDILSSYSQESLNKVWKALTTVVIKNYQSGKGTFIKGLGTFTFTNIEYNLEGTTNQFQRDIKLRRPVFIMSPEFIDSFRPGQYTKAGGLIYYTQKQNNSISVVKLNFAELSYGVSITKEEFGTVLNHLIRDMADQIKEGNFKPREMPGLGVFMVRANVFGMKFINEFNNEVMKIPQKLIFTKKNLGLYMDTTNTYGTPSDNLRNAEKAVGEIRPKTSVMTRITRNGDRWLKTHMNLNVQKDVIEAKDCPTIMNKSLENYDHHSRFTSNNFFTCRNLNKHLRHNTNSVSGSQSRGTTLKQLIQLNLPMEILESILGCKGQIIKEMKVYDRRNNGIISRFELIRAFNKANVHKSLPMNIIAEIVDIYAKNIDYIEYAKFITCLLKEVKIILSENSIDFEYGHKSNNSFNESFNNKFTLGPNTNNRNMNITNIVENTCSNYDKLKVNVDEVENEIKSIKIIFQQIMQSLSSKTKTSEYKTIIPPLTEFINYHKLNSILHHCSITYTIEKILKILKYIQIENPHKFTLETFNNKLIQCKVTSYEMSNEQLISAYNNILKIISSNGGSKNVLFKDNNSTLKCDQFISIIKPLTNYSSNILEKIFQRIALNKDSISLNEYIREYENPSIKFSNIFYDDACNKIRTFISKQKISVNTYFNKLLTYNYLRDANTLRKDHFIIAMQQEEYFPMFNEDELDFIFDKMDTNKDGRVERIEFKKAIQREQDAISKMQDIIKKLGLEVSDLIFRLDLKKDVNEKLTFYQFKTKMRNMDSTYSNEFIEGIFLELCGTLDASLNSNDLLKAFNVFKREHFRTTNNETFKNNFISNIQQCVDYHTLKQALESVDKVFNGKITKPAFCNIIKKFTNEFKDEDIMKFVRITNVTDPLTYEVIYTKFLNLIYYNAKLDVFLLCIEELKKELISPLCNKDIYKLISHINKSGVNFSSVNNENEQEISLDTLLNYFKMKLPKEYKEQLTKTMISKFDLDADGKVTYNDIKGVVLRYINTHFFKYENQSQGTLVNLFNTDKLSDEEFKKVVKEMKTILKSKNINDVGLFNKLDTNNDGFISNYDFNYGLGLIMEIAPAIKDKLYDYIDFYHNGQVDLETFLLRFKEFKSNEIIIENNNQIENDILKSFSEWITSFNEKLSDTELFGLLDKDRDGLISLEDFRFFVLDSLKFSPNEINDYKLERVMQSISLTKNLNISLGDIKEFIIRISNKDKKKRDYYIDLKETFKETKNQNLYKYKKNTDWISQAIERFGMYISEFFVSLDNFFEEFSDKKIKKFKFENFEEFHRKNYKCFYGFNLTRDELLAIYTSLDSQKKNFLTLDDLKHKLNLFDFYRKMHFDIKTFITKNFPTNIDAFKYFLTPNINQVISSSISKPFRNYLTKKEFFDGLNNLMPKKYTTETILKYYNNYFVPKTQEGLTNFFEQITFSAFSFVYYDKTVSNEEPLLRRTFNHLTKVTTTHPTSFSKTGNAFFDNKPFQTVPHPKLETPFDNDPLEKLRVLIRSSNKDYLKLIHKAILESGNGIVNHYEFRNIIKSLGLGLTSIEIENIINTSGKTRDNKINLNDFYKFVASDDTNLVKAQHNIKNTLAEIKQLLYKYYSNPKLAFEFSDNKKNNQMDFDTFKSIIGELYKRELRPNLNFVLLKETFNIIDQRKDGYIDMNEWTNSFGKNKGKLDLILNKRQINALRKWETSDNVIGIYTAIAHNKKVIWDKAKKYCFGKGNGAVIQEDNLIRVLKDVFPTLTLTLTQWKMIVEIADKDPADLIQLEQFITIVEHCATKAKSQPRF